ncbi:hypothetical protein [Wolbachia endosymbiont (group A) of Sicus ferrugineus]|uniref:hypothetical protein n=1 Tax=Wolbachia endosymbiont (group A) of Sicus ferrugineus TaxID=2954056 RepID=UPI00222EB468|nr:hypothetical protein [Wolbachia endosymbiont (group A) of Sicus ferrugineus]
MTLESRKKKEKWTPVSATWMTSSIGNPIPQEAEQNVGQTTSHTEYFKANTNSHCWSVK